MVRRLTVLIWVCLLVFVLMPAASAAPGTITLVSTNSLGIKGNSGGSAPFVGAVSAEGTRVAFYSSSTNLSPDDTDSTRDAYVKDLTTGAVFLASINGNGVKGNGINSANDISADGTHVAFQSKATNLVPGDTDIEYDVYVKDLVTGDLVLASTNESGVKSNEFTGGASLSADGTRVLFSSFASNLDPADTDTLVDAFVKDLTTGDITLVSANEAGVKANGPIAGGMAISADGTKVAFTSYATNLDPSDTDSFADVYVKDLVTGDITLASTNDSGVKGNGNSDADTSLSADGTVVAFGSGSTNLDPGDVDSIGDVYVKNLTTGELTLASITQNGTKADQDSGQVSLSADGSVVAFTTYADNLDPVDHQTLRDDDVYVKNLLTGALVLASSNADGRHAGDSSSNSPSITADGTKVVFTSGASNFDVRDPVRFDNDVYMKDLMPVPSGADLSLTKVDRRDPVRSGRTISYALSVQNLGPSSATGVTVTDQLPEGVTFVSATSAQATCSQSSGVVTCVFTAPVAVGGRASSVALVVTAQSPGIVMNTASVVGNEPDPNVSNNQDAESTTVT